MGVEDVRNHYEIHSMSNLIHRTKQLRTLVGAQPTPRSCATRAACRQLDRANMTLMVNVIKEESKLRDRSTRR